MKPFIDPCFWSDSDIEPVPAEVKLTALWLITNPQTSKLGVCGATDRRFSLETCLDVKWINATINALPRAFSRIGGVVVVRNYIRYQFGSGEKLMKNNWFVALKSDFLKIKDASLQAFLLSEYPEFQEALIKGFQGLIKPKDGKEGIGEDVSGKGGAGGKDNLPTSDRAKRIATMFNRKLTTEWSDKEIKAFKTIAKQPDEDFDIVESFYQSGYEFLRHDLGTFLNNFTGEVDKARKWKAGKLNGHSKRPLAVNPRVSGTANEGVSSQYRGIGTHPIPGNGDQGADPNDF